MPAGDQGVGLRSGSLKRFPQYMEVPPNIEGKKIVSAFSTLLFYSSNLSLLKDDSSLPSLPACWLTTCKYDLHDPGRHANEGSCREAQGVVPDDGIADWLPKDREGMPALWFLPEYGG